ncbi:DUF1003 domain-containing protein [Mucilaginibacter sp. 21P]|uniref:DUF1003 domain-containing protein n=1 Tax=Mucilaginibacter sp. 21P TaxID=2778902 RepID=UPI001C5988D8|nr:DUF1003 domain-containing protein [Mucilaginibacter sp. 21P]QXV63753.1 DUF1003 domain-containing protein [Mucilaginibacter sp. 21P]
MENTIEKQQATTNSEEQLRSSLNFTNSPIDKLAVLIIEVLGSMTFLISCMVMLTGWICWNVKLIPGLKPFDPFPFPTLEMAVSIFAIILSISVLINQNRQGRIEKIRQQVEFEINVRAEHEITRLLELVHEIHQKMGLSTVSDQELESMKQRTDLEEIKRTVDQLQSDAAADHAE